MVHAPHVASSCIGGGRSFSVLRLIVYLQVHSFSVLQRNAAGCRKCLCSQLSYPSLFDVTSRMRFFPSVKMGLTYIISITSHHQILKTLESIALCSILARSQLWKDMTSHSDILWQYITSRHVTYVNIEFYSHYLIKSYSKSLFHRCSTQRLITTFEELCRQVR